MKKHKSNPKQVIIEMAEDVMQVANMAVNKARMSQTEEEAQVLMRFARKLESAVDQFMREY